MGSSVSAKKARTIRTEVLCRLACHNITGKKNQDSGLSLYFRKFKKAPFGRNFNYESRFEYLFLVLVYQAEIRAFLYP
jgi:hypothetical protein